MIWQARHRELGLFMGIAHGNGHYSRISECCRSMGVFQFVTDEQIESLFVAAENPRLPGAARLKRTDFLIEPWSVKDNDLLEMEGLEQDCSAYTSWVMATFPQGIS